MKNNYLTIILLLAVNQLFAQAPNFEWAHGIGGKGSDLIKDIVIDSKNNVISIGTFSDEVDIDPSSNVKILTPTIGKDTTKKVDVFITKNTSDGRLLWAYNLKGFSTDDAINIVTDKDDNLYIMGTFYDSLYIDPPTNSNLLEAKTVSANVFFAKYDKDLNYIWGKNFESSSITKNIITPTSFDIDKFGNLYIVGTFSLSVDFNPNPLFTNALTASANANDLFMAKYTNDGNFIWAKQLQCSKFANSTASAPINPRKIVYDKKSNSFYIAGHYKGIFDLNPDTKVDTISSNKLAGVGYEDIFFAKYDTSGSFIWGKGVGGANYDRLSALCLDTIGNVYITGSFNHITNFNPGGVPDTLIADVTYSDAYLAKYNTNGIYQWAKKFGGTNSDIVNSILISKDGSIILAGYYYSKKIDLNPSELPADTAYFTNLSSSSDIYLTAFDRDGNYNWAISLGGSQIDDVTCLQEGVSGSLFLGGKTTSTKLYLNNTDTAATYTKPTSNGAVSDSYLAKYSFCTLNKNVNVASNSITSLDNTSGANYQWYNCETNSPISGAMATKKTLQVTSAGKYKVVVSLDGCTTTSDCVTMTTSLNDATLYNNIHLYPNPTNNVMQLSIDGKPFGNKQVTISLIDLLGNVLKEVHHGELSSNYKTEITISDISNGVYFLQINNQYLKIIKE